METQETTKLMTMTETAAEAVRELLEDRELEGYGLRVFVSGGGVQRIPVRHVAGEGSDRE